MTIKVSLDTSANPPVTVDPDCHNVNQGNETIIWVRAANQVDFDFSSLTIPDPPFGVPSIADSEISVTDQNDTPETYSYTISVTYGGNTYTSTKIGPAAGSGNPTIKNN
jgi:hypothetical protein